jgi:hypothetical protein
MNCLMVFQGNRLCEGKINGVKIAVGDEKCNLFGQKSPDLLCAGIWNDWLSNIWKIVNVHK